MQRILRGRIVFTPRADGSGYDYEAKTRFDRLFAGVACPMPEWMKKMVATGELGIEGTKHIRREDTMGVDYARLLERAHARLSRKVDKRRWGPQRDSVPAKSWESRVGHSIIAMERPSIDDGERRSTVPSVGWREKETFVMSGSAPAIAILAVLVIGSVSPSRATAQRNTRSASSVEAKETQMPDLAANRKLVQEQWDAFNRGDLVAAAEFFAEDTRNHGRPVGRAGVLAVLKDIQATFPDVRFAPLEYVCDGEWVTVRGMFSGTHRGVGRIPVNGGMLVGVEPTGRHFEVQHIHMLQLRGGKIVEHFANRDDLGMMQQLALLPTPSPPKGR